MAKKAGTRKKAAGTPQPEQVTEGDDFAMILALACIDPERLGPYNTVSSPIQKTVLMCLWAFEGEYISNETLAHFSGIDQGTAKRATGVLHEQGLVDRDRENGYSSYRYQINRDAVRATCRPCPLNRERYDGPIESQSRGEAIYERVVGAQGVA